MVAEGGRRALATCPERLFIEDGRPRLLTSEPPRSRIATFSAVLTANAVPNDGGTCSVPDRGNSCRTREMAGNLVSVSSIEFCR